MKKTLLILCLCAFSPYFVKAEEHHHGHSHSRNEIGLSGGAMYSSDHKKWGAGTHIHYYRTFTAHSKWSFGAMAEYAYIDGSHTTLGAGIKYEIIHGLNIGILPGVTFLEHKHKEDGHDAGHSHKHKKTQFSTHFELVYDLIHLDKFHFGPVLDYSVSKGDNHGMIGVHAAFCF